MAVAAIASLIVGAGAAVRALAVASVALLAVTRARRLTVALASTATSTIGWIALARCLGIIVRRHLHGDSAASAFLSVKQRVVG